MARFKVQLKFKITAKKEWDSLNSTIKEKFKKILKDFKKENGVL